MTRGLLAEDQLIGEAGEGVGGEWRKRPHFLRQGDSKLPVLATLCREELAVGLRTGTRLMKTAPAVKTRRDAGHAYGQENPELGPYDITEHPLAEKDVELVPQDGRPAGAVVAPGHLEASAEGRGRLKGEGGRKARQGTEDPTRS